MKLTPTANFIEDSASIEDIKVEFEPLTICKSHSKTALKK